MGRIVAIGGGEIGRPGHPHETTSIDREILELTGKNNPKLLFIPTASTNQRKYYADVQKHFGQELGCITDCLYLPNKEMTPAEMRKRVMCADVIYVGGGNTAKMIKVWRQCGLDKVLREAHEKGILMTGLSAGAICWFRDGNSDSGRFKDPDAALRKVVALGIIDALLCPHFISEPDRRDDLKEMMKSTSGVAIALSNCSAIEIMDDNFRLLSSGCDGQAFKTFWKEGLYHEIPLEISGTYRSLTELLSC